MKYLAVLLLAAGLLAATVGCNHHDNEQVSPDDGGYDVQVCDGHGHCHITHVSPGATVTQPVPAPTASVQIPATIQPDVPQTPPPSSGQLVSPPSDAGDDVGDDLNFEDKGVGIDKAAVIVGINKYPGNALEGCVNDAENICKLHTAAINDAIQLCDVYVKGYGFKRRNVKLLLDGDATTDNIRKALVWLAVKSHPAAGNARLFWYSGHGAEDAISDDAQGEPDHLNQLMCPVDFDWTRQHMLIDKDLVAIFAQMPAGVAFYWGSDSCHSGDLDKGIVSKRTLHRKQFPNPPAEVKARIAKVKAKQALMHRNLVNGILDVGFISGCKSDETSADSSDDHGVPCGAFTNEFIHVLSKNQQASLATLATELDQNLNMFDQHPQAEGNRKSKAWMQP